MTRLTAQQVRAALTKMATSLKLPSAHDGRKKGHHVIGRFLQQHALGLTTRMVEDINDSYATHPPVQEQKRCIKAMEEMVVLCKDYIRIARPQVCSRLSSLHIIFANIIPDIRLSFICPLLR